MREPGAHIWTRQQRVVLGAIVLILCAAFAARAWRNPQRVGDPTDPAGPRAAELLSKIDPNTADWPAWAALPLIGEKRARQIVEFRDKWAADHPGEIPFATPQDLTRVKGIGKATVETLAPYLAFPDAPVEP
jgi:competence protein ComEA